MEHTIRLDLPFIQASQAQKHITHNEALLKLDQITQLSVRSQSFDAPPTDPIEGDRYIAPVPSTWPDATAAHLYSFEAGAWVKVTPQHGWMAWVQDTQTLVVFDGTDWVPALGQAALANLTVKGSNAYFEATAQSEHFYLTLAKSLAAQRLGLGFNGTDGAQALLELTDTDTLRITVTKDGTTYRDALAVDLNDGIVSMGTTPRCEVSTNYDNYISADTATAINLNQAITNPTELHDAATGTLVIPKDGTYMLGYTLAVRLDQSLQTDIQATVSAQDDGTLYAPTTLSTATASLHTLQGHGLCQLNAGQVLSLNITVNGQAGTALQNATRLWCFKIA